MLDQLSWPSIHGCLAQTGHLTGASTSAAACSDDAERTATMQAPAELAEWLR